jgi:hypothetical protein
MRVITLLKSAIDAFDADQIDIDYEDGENIVYALKGNSGISIANLSSEQWKEIASELSGIRKPTDFLVNNIKFRISVYERLRFGETQYTISIKKLSASMRSRKRAP